MAKGDKHQLKVGFVPMNEAPRIETIEGIEDEDGYVSYYEGIRDLIGCRMIESFDPLYGDEPLLWVDDEGIYNSLPNRAVFGNKRMEEVGYLNHFNHEEVIKEDYLYCVLFGNIVAVSYEYDDEGDDIARDITDEEFEQLKSDFQDIDSGLMGVMAIKNGFAETFKRVWLEL